MSDTRYIGHDCPKCGTRERYVKSHKCCYCNILAVKKSRSTTDRGPTKRRVKAKDKVLAVKPAPAKSDFIKPPTRAQLMAGR